MHCSVSWRMAANEGGTSRSPREQGLQQVAEWFAPALQPGETLQAALAATPYPLTMVNSLVGTAKDLVGRNQGRVLLLTDRAIHVAGRQFWRRRFRVLLGSFPLGTVSVRYASGELWIHEQSFYLNPSGYQLGGAVGSATDIELIVRAGVNS